MTWRPDPSFYPSPRMAMKAPAEKFAYVAAFDPTRQKPDAIAVVDVDPGSKTYANILGNVEMPSLGDELHHFGWNACSSCLCPNAPHPHVERRYLVVPGLRSSRIHILDTKPDPRQPKIVKVIEPEEIAEKTGYTRPHTIHCGPGGIYVAALGDQDGKAPGGIFMIDHESLPLGRWEVERGPQRLSYDVWWHLGYDTLVTSEWGTPDTFENGLVPEVLLGGKYGRRLHFFDFTKRKHLQEIDLGPEYQLVFELRPAHDPTKAYGFVNSVISLKDLSSSICRWTTASSTSPAGAPETCSSTTCPIRSSPSSPASCASAASCRARAIRAPRTARSAAHRRWSRSAVTASACISQTRSTAASTRNCIPMESTAGW